MGSHGSLSVIAEHNPRLVIVCLGGNDMLRKVADPEIRRNLAAIVKTLNERGIAAVLVGVPRPALITSAPEFYAEIAKEAGIPDEGKVVTSVLYSNETKSDPIHPNAMGYRRMAGGDRGALAKGGGSLGVEPRTRNAERPGNQRIAKEG